MESGASARAYPAPVTFSESFRGVRFQPKRKSLRDFPADLSVPAGCFSEIFRDFQRFSKIFRDFQRLSEIFRDVQRFSEMFRDFPGGRFPQIRSFSGARLGGQSM